MINREITVTVKVQSDDMSRAKDKMEILKRISDLPAEDQQRIIELCRSPKALKGLADNWDMLQTMFK